MFERTPRKIYPIEDAEPGDTIGYALYWGRVSADNPKKNEYELILDNDGYGYFFEDFDDAWAADKDFDVIKPGWTYYIVRNVCIK